MRPSDSLAQFVRDALLAGRSREQITTDLTAAGWSETETRAALAAWADVESGPPVPRPRSTLSAQEAFVYGLLFACLAMSAWHLTSLSYGLIDLWLPDQAGERWRFWQISQVRWSTAALIVFAPAFLVLNVVLSGRMRADPARRRSAVRRWIGYVVLFIATITLMGDLLYVIYWLLNGELTARVTAKAVATALVAASLLAYFRQSLREDAYAQ